MRKTEYRSDSVFGEGIREPVKVVAHEFFELGNTDIPEYILKHYDVPEECQKEWKALIDEMDKNAYVDDVSESDKLAYADRLIQELSKAVHKEIKYVLWLTSREDVLDLYEADPDDIDEYEVSDVILSDVGHDGRLYGYTNDPEPVKNSLQRYQEDYARWKYIYANGSMDVSCYDGGNLFVLRNRLQDERAVVERDMEQGLIPQQDIPSLPPKVPFDYLARREERVGYIRGFKEHMLKSQEYQDYLQFAKDFAQYNDGKETFPYVYFLVERLMKTALDDPAKIHLIPFRQFGRADVWEWWSELLAKCQGTINALKAKFSERKATTLMCNGLREETVPWGQQLCLF